MVDKPKKKLSWKAWTAIAVGVIVLGSIGNAMSDGGEPSTAAPGVSATPSDDPSVAAASKMAEQDAKKAEKEASRAKAAKEQDAKVAALEKENQDWADDMYSYWLSSLNIKSPLEILDNSPHSVQGFVNGAASPVVGTLVLTAQVTENDVDQAELDRSSKAILQIIGYDHEDVDRVELVTADGSKRGVANRRDSLLLNK